MEQDPENSKIEGAEQQTQEQSYAVKPQHHYRRLEYSDKKNLKLRNMLNIAFMVLAIVGVVMWSMTKDHTVASIILIVAVVIKIAEVSIRLFRK